MQFHRGNHSDKGLTMRRLVFLFPVFILCSSLVIGQVIIRERLSINPTKGRVSTSISDPDAPYEGKISMKISGRLHLKWRFITDWFVESHMVGICDYGCTRFIKGPIIQLEAPYTQIIYDASQYWGPMNCRVPCEGDSAYYHDFEHDPWEKDSLEYDIGPFAAGDELILSVGPSGCRGARFYAQNVAITAQNPFKVIHYQLSKGMKGEFCEAIDAGNLFWIDGIKNTNMDWLQVEVLDPPPSVPTYLVASYSPTQINQCEIAILALNYFDQCGEEYVGGLDGTFDVKVTKGKDSVCLMLLDELPPEYTDVVVKPDELLNVPVWAYVGIRLKQRFSTLTEFKTEVTARVTASGAASKVSSHNASGQAIAHLRKSVAGNFSRKQRNSSVQKKTSISNIPKINSLSQSEGISATAAVNAKPGSCVNEIMLGETKYYQAIQDPEWDENLLFNEYKLTTERVNTGLGDVKYTVEIFEGDKLGVYYDEYKNEQGGDLENDIIRLIGRYWDANNPDKPYIIKLTAEVGYKYGETFIEVTKPVKLLTPGQRPTYRLSRDVFNGEINIDDTCIAYGGRYGIPPHFLKGQMLKEAGTINLANDEKGFAPSYRYEPFSKNAQLSNAWKVDPRYNGGLWVVDPKRTGREMGTGKEVPSHNNVQDMAYPKTVKYVWDILCENSELVNTGATKEHKIYGTRLLSGKMVFPSQYDEINKKYSTFRFISRMYTNLLGEFSGLTVQFSSRPREGIAREKMIEFLRDEWHGGAKKMVAQTRLASSYGLLQMMYSTAVGTKEMDYPSLDPNISPEDFNVTTTNMTYSLQYMKNLLKKVVIPSSEENNWSNGFEYWFKNYVWPIWNTGTTSSGSIYANGVFSCTQKFLPQSE